MCMAVCVCVWPCVYVYGRVCMCMVVCVCVWPCVYVYGRVCMYMPCVCVWPCVYVYGRVCMCMVVCVCVWPCVFDWYLIRMSVRSGVMCPLDGMCVVLVYICQLNVNFIGALREAFSKKIKNK